MFEFGVISRFRQEMLAVKGMVRLTESELAVLFGVQGVPSEWAGLGAATACVSTAFRNEGTENRVFQNYYRISKGPLVLTVVSDSNTSKK